MRLLVIDGNSIANRASKIAVLSNVLRTPKYAFRNI